MSSRSGTPPAVQVPSQVVELHLPCPKCGSSDAASRYSDGHFYCFACSRRFTGSQGPSSSSMKSPSSSTQSQLSDLLHLSKVVPLTKRHLTADTCQRFNYRVRQNLKGE